MKDSLYQQIGLIDELSLGQVSSLVQVLKDPYYPINKLLIIDDKSFEKLQHITQATKSYIYTLINNKQWTKLAEVLISLGFEKNIWETN